MVHSHLIRYPNTNAETGLDALIELFLYDPPYANTIQTVCPHILRYLSTAVIVQSQTQKRKGVMKQLIKVIQQESYIYKVRMLFLETRGHCWGLNYLAPAKYFSPQHCPLGECCLRSKLC